jgi:hypothetical protein
MSPAAAVAYWGDRGCVEASQSPHIGVRFILHASLVELRLLT